MMLCASPTTLSDTKHLYHSGGFNSHLVSMAAGSELLRLHDQVAVKSFCNKGEELSDRLREGIARVQQDYPEFRGQILQEGPILQIHFGGHPIVSAEDVSKGAEHTLAWYQELLLRGFLTTPGVLVLLSLAQTDARHDAFVMAHDGVLRTIARNMRIGKLGQF